MAFSPELRVLRGNGAFILQRVREKGHRKKRRSTSDSLMMRDMQQITVRVFMQGQKTRRPGESAFQRGPVCRPCRDDTIGIRQRAGWV